MDGGDREAENRELAAFPHWDGTWSSARAYPDAFTAWFEDHFAFRADLVRWYAESRLFGLGVSPSSAVLKGEDQWLYYGDDGGVVDYANATPLTPGEAGAWREALVRARDWLRHRGIAYVFTIAPDKHVIYPEHVPSTIRVVHGRVTDRSDLRGARPVRRQHGRSPSGPAAGQDARTPLLSHRHPLERPRGTRRLPAHHRRGASAGAGDAARRGRARISRPPGRGFQARISRACSA